MPRYFVTVHRTQGWSEGPFERPTLRAARELAASYAATMDYAIVTGLHQEVVIAEFRRSQEGDGTHWYRTTPRGV